MQIRRQYFLTVGTCLSLAIGVGIVILWMRSVWTEDLFSSERFYLTAGGGETRIVTSLSSAAGLIGILRQVNDGPGDPGDLRFNHYWDWETEPHTPKSSLREMRQNLWFRGQFSRYKLPPKGLARMGDRGYSLMLAIPDWAVLAASLVWPVGLAIWRSKRQRHRAIGFNPISTPAATRIS